jgi:NTE family protein
LQALSFLTQQRLIRDVADLADQAELHVLPPLCPLSIASADFGLAGELIHRARNATSEWLDNGRDRLPRPERFLSLHEHAPPAGSALPTPDSEAAENAARMGQ